MTEQEFNQAAQRHLDMVYRIALNALRRPADAEDAAQTVMLRLWQSRETFEGEDHLRHWLVRVTVNVCRDLTRSAWYRRIVPLEHCPEPSFSAPEEGRLYDAVMALPGKYRLPLYLYYYEGYKIKEIADILHKKENTIHTWLRRAKKELRDLLGGDPDEFR